MDPTKLYHRGAGTKDELPGDRIIRLLCQAAVWAAKLPCQVNVTVSPARSVKCQKNSKLNGACGPCSARLVIKKLTLNPL